MHVLPSSERIHIPPGEVRKIIDSKVPAGRGICDRSLEGICINILYIYIYICFWLLSGARGTPKETNRGVVNKINPGVSMISKCWQKECKCPVSQEI